MTVLRNQQKRVDLVKTRVASPLTPGGRYLKQLFHPPTLHIDELGGGESKLTPKPGKKEETIDQRIRGGKTESTKPKNRSLKIATKLTTFRE